MRQQARLNKLVSFVRTRSRHLNALYKDVPEHVTDIRQLPPVTKREMMTHFDEWVTDPEVTKARAEAFAADASSVGKRFLGRYTIWTTSGSTGTPALLVQDEYALTVMAALAWARAVPAWIGSLARSAMMSSMNSIRPVASYEGSSFRSPKKSRRQVDNDPIGIHVQAAVPNYVQPIIRYDLGDRITMLPDLCTCGSALPSVRVEGRSDEILTFRSPSGDDVHLLPVALATSIAESRASSARN